MRRRRRRVSAGTSPACSVHTDHDRVLQWKYVGSTRFEVNSPCSVYSNMRTSEYLEGVYSECAVEVYRA